MKRISSISIYPAAVLIIAFLLTAGCCLAADLNLPLLWSVDLHTFLESAPTVADINKDGREEILVAGREELIALNKNGTELWRWRTRQRFMTYPAVLQRPGQSALIYVADTAKLFSCLNGEGEVVWQAELNGPTSWSAPVLADLNGDAKMEVIATDESGMIWIFDAVNGRVISKSQVTGMPSSPSAADLQGDGYPDVVVMTGEGILYAIDYQGVQRWQHELGATSPSWATSSPVVFSASDGQVRIVAAANSGLVACLDAAGNRLWSFMAQGPVASTLSVGDLDQDGRADVFLITQTGRVYRLDEAGSLIWDIDMQGRSLASGAIIDLNDDGQLEYLLCTQNGNMIGFDLNGTIIYNYQFPCRTINMTPTFGDVCRGTNDLELVVTGGESGISYCFGTDSRKNGLAQWSSYRMNDHNTGAWFGLKQSLSLRMTPDNLFWNQINTGDAIRFSIWNPKPGTAPLQASAVCIRPDGSRQTASTKVVAKTDELILPLQVTMPGSYHFTWSLQNEKGQRLVSGEKALTWQPFANDKATVNRALAMLTASADQVKGLLPLSATALRREATELEKENRNLAISQDAVPADEALAVEKSLSESKALVSRARRAQKIAALAQQAASLGAGTSLLAFEGKLWENRQLNEQLPEIVANPLQIQRTVVPGEHEPISIKLFNLTDRLLQVRVIAPPNSPQLTVTPHYSIPIPTSQGQEAWDALPELDESAVISIPSLSTREIWLDVHLAAIAPGTYNQTAVFQALNGAGVLDAPTNPHGVAAPETRVEMTLHVLPFTMAPSSTIRLCTWSPNQGPELKDLLNHGNNVFTVPHGVPSFDEASRITGVDFSSLDAILPGFKGEDVMVLLSGMPNMKSELASALFKSNLREYLKHLLPYMQRQGFDLNHFALYPIDEPGGLGWDYVNQLVAFAKMVREINPDILVYMDGGGELPMFQAMAPVIDIWVPGIDMLAEESPVMRVIRSSGKSLWSYNCSYSYSRPIGANIKNTNLLAEFRTAALFAFRHNATGIGYWCYNAGGEDPWMRNQLEYKLIYPGRSKPVTSRRWEAVREGLEDFRILTALQKATLACDEPTRKKIDQLLHQNLAALVDPGYTAMKIGLNREAIEAACNESKLNVFRREMLECVKAVTEKN